jgi:hypothetical protein
MIEEILKERMIERHFYLQKIQNFLDSKVVKVLV